MASFLNADLPSEDEEDDNFDPELEHDDSKPKKKQKTGTAGVSRRGCAAGTQPGKAAVGALDDVEKAAQAKRKARAASKFQELQSSMFPRSAQVSDNSIPTSANVPSTVEAVARPAGHCISSTQQKRKLYDPDAYWMYTLGIMPPPKRKQATPGLVDKVLSGSYRSNTSVSEQYHTPTQSQFICAGREAKQPDVLPTPPPERVVDSPANGDVLDYSAAAATQAAAQALKNITAGLHAADGAQQAGMIRIVEKRNFAGREVEIARDVQAGSKAAEKVQARASAAANKSGLDAALANISGPRKANVIDKSADDWQGFKAENEGIKDELNEYNKSSDKYLEKQAFLKRAELTEYEIQRDARLQGDIRTRARA